MLYSVHCTLTIVLRRSFTPKRPQETASKGVAQGPYVATRAGFEPNDPSDEKRRIYKWTTTPHVSALP